MVGWDILVVVPSWAWESVEVAAEVPWAVFVAPVVVPCAVGGLAAVSVEVVAFGRVWV